MATESEAAAFTITMDQIQDYQFRVRFDKETYPDLLLDEPPPIGRDTAPNPSRILAAAVGNCLSASFLFSARKVRLNLEKLHASVQLWYQRNEQGRLRIGTIKVVVTPTFESGSDSAKIERCRALFEEYCVVTQSVRHGIETLVEVKSNDTPVQ
jgi:uncharacterized OsmC-like protein